MYNFKNIILFIAFLISSSTHAIGDSRLQLEISNKYNQLTKGIDVTAISSEDLTKMDPSEYILVDVRSLKEQKVSMLPNSIPSSIFEKNPQTYSGKKIIAYCTIGYRSGLFAQKYKKLKIVNLIGGVLSWSHINGKFINNGKETKRVHTYSKKWNFLNKKYQAIFN